MNSEVVILKHFHWSDASGPLCWSRPTYVRSKPEHHMRALTLHRKVCGRGIAFGLCNNKLLTKRHN
jgi:hypothetical protein